MKALDLTGQTFGQLNALTKGTTSRMWVCRCTCGVSKEVRSDHLKSGKVISCGCQKVTHGHTAGGRMSPEYTSWKAMKGRCADVSVKSHGGSGVKVCDRWQDFTNFLADMGLQPPNTSLDRKDPFEDYAPWNCQWGTSLEQASNKRKKILLGYNYKNGGPNATPSEWVRHLRKISDKPKWTVKLLNLVLGVYSMEQIVDSYNIHRRSPQQLVTEAARRGEQKAIRKLEAQAKSFGDGRARQLTPKENRAKTNAKAGKMFSHMMDSDREIEPGDLATMAAIRSGDRSDPAHPRYTGPYALNESSDDDSDQDNDSDSEVY